ncbi:hypothetical protein HKD37_14G040087 [Glycine soja]
MRHWIEKLQVDWARDAREGPRVLMSLRSTKFRALLSLSLHSSPSSSKLLSMASYGVASPLSFPFSIPLPFIFQEAKESIDEEDPRPTSSNGACIMWYQEHLHLGLSLEFILPFVFKPPTRKNHNLGTNMSLHSSSSVNGEGSTPKDPLYKILDELRSLKLWKEKQERKEKGKKRVEEISQDERKKIREEERRKIMKEIKREKHVSYSSHNSCKSLSEELRDYYEGRHSEEIYPQEEGQPLMVKEECKEVSVSSKRLAKKERHFEIKTNIKEISLLRQPPHFLLCKKTLVSIATSLRLEFIPQVKELLDEGLVRKRLNPCALLVPKIGIIRHQIPKIGGVMNALGGATLFCKITHAPNIFMICVHRDSLGRFVLIFSFNTNLGTHMGHLRFVILFGRNNQHENTEKGVKGRSPEYQEPQDLRDAREGPRVLMSLRTHLLLEVASPLSFPFSIPLPFIFQEAKESIDEEDPRPTSSNGACIRYYNANVLKRTLTY